MRLEEAVDRAPALEIVGSFSLTRVASSSLACSRSWRTNAPERSKLASSTTAGARSSAATSSAVRSTIVAIVLGQAIGQRVDIDSWR